MSQDTELRTTRPRRASVTVAAAVVVVYLAVVFVIQSSSGIDYDDWFDTAASVWRTAVLSLVVGGTLVAGAAAYLRWGGLWRDAHRLPMRPVYWAVLVAFALAVAVRVPATDWAAVPGELLLAVAVTGVLVGFTEEMLFRGLVLRSLRDGRRPEAWAAVWSSVAFGLFHLPNLLQGTGLRGLAQVAAAALSGVVLYLFRRAAGLIVVAMAAHGLWDATLFVGAYSTEGVLDAVGLVLGAVVIVLSVVALVVLVRRERDVVVAPPPGRRAR